MFNFHSAQSETEKKIIGYFDCWIKLPKCTALRLLGNTESREIFPLPASRKTEVLFFGLTIKD